LVLEQLEDHIVPTIVFEPAFGAEATLFGSGQKLNATPVQLIFWGSTYWDSPSGAQAADVTNAFATLLGSAYYSHLSQYGAGGGTNYLASSWIDTFDIDPGSTVADSQIRAVIINAINDPSSPILPPSNFNSVPLYVVVTPYGTAIDGSTIPMQGNVAFQGGVQGGDKATVGYHYDFNAGTNYGNYNLVYAWIGNYTLSGMGGLSNLDSLSAIFSHESSEAMTDSQPFSGITTSAGPSLPDGGGFGEIGDFEPEDFNVEDYRVDGVLAQATWDYNYQAFVVSDGTSQNFYIYPQYTYSDGSYTFAGNVLDVYGDQSGANSNDTITISTTDSGGWQVTLNGETAVFEPGLAITTLNVLPAGGDNEINVLATPLGTTTLINDQGIDTVTVGNYNSALNYRTGDMSSVNGLVDIFGTGSTSLYLDDSGDSIGQHVSMYDGSILGLSPATIQWSPWSASTGGVTYLAVYGGSGGNTFDVHNTSNFPYATYLSTGTGHDNVYVYATTGDLYDYNPGGLDSTFLGGGYTGSINGQVDVYGAGSTYLYLDDSNDTTARTAYLYNGEVTGLSPANIYWTATSSLTGGVSYLAIYGGSGGNRFVVGDTSDFAYSTDLSTGSGDDTVYIYATTGRLNVNNPGGSDFTDVGVGSLTNIQGTVTLSGGGGSNNLSINDSSGGSGLSYSLSATQLTRSGAAAITYASLAALEITAGGNDTLTLLSPVRTAPTTINGGSGTNTLQGANVDNTWAVSGVNSGKVGSVSFSNFQKLMGGAANDTFEFAASTARVSTINGGSGANKLDYSALGSGFVVRVTLSSDSAGSAPLIPGGFSMIGFLAGSTDTANTLTGPNLVNVWIISGTNAGTLNTFAFTAMPNLQGGANVDTFAFTSPTASRVRSIRGGTAPSGKGDWLNYASFGSSSLVRVNLATGSAANVNSGLSGSIWGIQNVLGSGSGTNILTGDAQGNILIGGSGSNTLFGGTRSSLLIGGSGHGAITGGSGQDIEIAGTTAYNAATIGGRNALMSLLAELQSTNTFAQKVSDIIHGNNLGGGSDLNGSNKLTWGVSGATVKASLGAFKLTGDSSASATADWFFANAASIVSDFNDDGVHDEHNNNGFGMF
jgi:hypothetical protein